MIHIATDSALKRLVEDGIRETLPVNIPSWRASEKERLKRIILPVYADFKRGLQIGQTTKRCDNLTLYQEQTYFPQGRVFRDQHDLCDSGNLSISHFQIVVTPWILYAWQNYHRECEVYPQHIPFQEEICFIRTLYRLGDITNLLGFVFDEVNTTCSLYSKESDVGIIPLQGTTQKGEVCSMIESVENSLASLGYKKVSLEERR